MPDPGLWQSLAIAFVGLFAGALGGMLGVGGSVIMIPALTIVLGRHQHLWQASAMVINVAVAIPAVLRHRKAGALNPPVLKWMLPVAIVAIFLGVAASNLPLFAGQDGGLWLGRLLAVFLGYVIVVNILRMRQRRSATRADADSPDESGESLAAARITAPRAGAAGGAMGFVAGLLGIGGGAVAVPLQQTLLRLPLRNCIANSSAVMCASAGFGAIYKNATLSGHYPDGSALGTSLWIALLLAPTAIIGSRIGAGLTHRLPVRQVRVAFIALMVVAAWKMAAIPWSPF